MSRIGKMPIALPAGVTVEFKNGVATVKGPKGTLTREVVGNIGIETEGTNLVVKALDNASDTNAKHGLYRALLNGMVVGVSEKMMDRFEFIIIPTTHLHMMGFTLDEKDGSTERRAELYVERFARLMEKDLPWHKIGLAHITCPLLNNTYDGVYLDTLKLIKDETFAELFSKAAKIGMGIELNEYIENYEGEELEVHMNIYRIAKNAGCKFYFGSDAHTPDGLRKAPPRFEKFIDLLDLKEEDKFNPFN